MIIAEIGQAHDGSLGILHSYIDALAATGVDVIKFQTHIAAAESSEWEQFRVPFSKVDATRFDYWKRMELTLSQWKEVKNHCTDAGVEFMSSPFSCAAVDLLEQVGVQRYKVGSGEVSNHLLLQHIAATGRPVILSSGMSNLEELDSAVSLFTGRQIPVSLLQCTAAYPTTPHQWGLSILKGLKNRFNIPVGFSDHSGDIYACLAATALGAEIIEFHTVFDKRMFGPDAKASLTIDETKRLVEGIGQIRSALSNDCSKDEMAANLPDIRQMFGKSLAVNKALKADHVITIQDLEAKKPAGRGIPPRDYKKVLGARVKHHLNQWQFITETDIQLCQPSEKFV